jgi:hypothetical protein
VADLQLDDFSQQPNPDLIDQIHILIEEQPEYLQHEDILKTMARTKYKELLRETVAEHNRRGNFIRIYPAYGSDMYDKFFQESRPFNRYIYRVLYTDYFGIEKITAKRAQAVNGIAYNEEWEKLKFGYKVKMPKDLAKNAQFKNQGKADEMAYEIGSEKSNHSSSLKENKPTENQPISFYNDVPNQEEAPTPDHRPSPSKVKLLVEDILIEYCTRLMNILKNMNEAHLTKNQREQITNFVTHHGFKKKDSSILVASGQAEYG